MSFQDRVQHQIAQIDKELSKYPVLNNLERQTSVPKVYAFLGIAGIYVFLVFFNIAGALLVNIAGFAIPGYYSLNALFTSSTADDTQWLTVGLPNDPPCYWVVFSLFSVVESAISAAYWFPFYYLFKFFFVLWMALPQTSGAQIVFHSFIQPVFSRYFQSAPTSANLRAQAEQAAKEHSS
ncbi:ER membrane protein DP1/Yop1 [Microsporum canis]